MLRKPHTQRTKGVKKWGLLRVCLGLVRVVDVDDDLHQQANDFITVASVFTAARSQHKEQVRPLEHLNAMSARVVIPQQPNLSVRLIL
jgi:hypothetical protein